MILEEFSKNENTGPVEKVKAGAVYFATEGRNAWHSTWVVKYTKNSVHSTLASAKSFCERKRKSGSVFYVKRLPCLVLIFSKGAVVVTEINSDNPLSRHLLLSELPGKDVVVAKRLVINSLKDVSDVRVGFGVHSHVWASGRGKPNSILIMQHKDSSKLEGQPESSKIWRSSSIGGDYKLMWRESEGKIKSIAVTNMVSNLRSLIGCDQSFENDDVAESGKVVDFFGERNKRNDGILAVKSLLRKVAVERKFKGSNSSREHAINIFIDELFEVFTERMIVSLEDTRLGDLFEDWLRSLSKLSREERIEALIESQSTIISPFLLYAASRDKK